MELGLSVGNSPSKIFDGVSQSSKAATNTTSSPSAADSFGFEFCMNIADGRTNHDDDQISTPEVQPTEKEKPTFLAINPPVQLDLLPITFVPLPWSSDIGSDGGSSRNALSGKGFDVINDVPVCMTGTEEATSSLRLEYGSYSRPGKDTFEMERAFPKAIDEDENGVYRKKLRLSKEQSVYLEESYKHRSTPDSKQKLELAKQLNLNPRQVEVWFQNRRARTKLKQTEVDCEYLKKCCETLTVENRRLHKELQELMVSKTISDQFCLRTTTLTMCPSCEHATTTATDKSPLYSTTPNTELRETM